MKRCFALIVFASALSCVPPGEGAPPPAPAKATTMTMTTPLPPVTPASTLGSTFSRDIVGDLAPRVPVAGEYAMSLSMRFAAFITMEMRVSEERRGALRLTLAPDGSARACLGVRTKRVVNGQPRYQPPDQREYREDEDTRLIALAGAWQIVDGVAEIQFDRIAWRTCDVAAATPSPSAGKLRCIAVAKNDRLPEGSLACIAPDDDRGQLLELGLDMASSTATPRRREAPPMGRHFVLGADGLHIDVTKEARGATARATFTFRAQPVTLTGSDYLPKQERPNR